SWTITRPCRRTCRKRSPTISRCAAPADPSPHGRRRRKRGGGNAAPPWVRKLAQRGELLLVVLAQLLELFARHPRDEVTVAVDAGRLERHGDPALADTEEAADVRNRVEIAVAARARNGRDLADVLS